MTDAAINNSFYIGWDVGGWNCDRNKKSRDAIVILDPFLSIFGQSWRGNLRSIINSSDTTQEFLEHIFSLCGEQFPETAQITLAIDTPLGFSGQFAALVNNLNHAGPIGSSGTNPYLYRQTEHFLFEKGLSPLSAVKDMIGSQATKGMHVLSKFSSHTQECGVWSDGCLLTSIEAYPSACKKSRTVNSLAKKYSSLGHEDKDDALLCALIAYLFKMKRDLLFEPNPDISLREGWIWVPRDSFEK